MRSSNDDMDVMGGIRSPGDAHSEDGAAFDAARAAVCAGVPMHRPVASPELSALLREGTSRRSPMNPLAKIAGLGLAGKLTLVGGVALAASAGGLTAANLATAGNSHAGAGLAKAAAASSADHSANTAGDSSDGAQPANHGACVAAVATSTPQPSDSPNAHGEAVSAVAQSDCGKPSQDGQGQPDSLPSQASSHATDHPTDKPATVPPTPAHPTGQPTTLPAHPTGAPATHPGH